MPASPTIWNKYVHLTPGRIRLKVPDLKKNDYLAERLHDALERIDGIAQVRTNLLTGTLLANFDETKVQGLSIIVYVDDQRKGYSYPLKVQDKLNPMITRRAYKLVLISSVLSLLFLKQKLFGRSALSNSKVLNNTSTITGLIIAYPLFLWGLKHPQKTRRKHYDFLINALTFSLLVLQESSLGLLLLLLINYSKMITALDFMWTQRIISRIGKLPEKVWVLSNGGEISIPLAQVEKGDIVVVRSAEIIPVDGEVAAGSAAVDESQISGLSQPVNKKSGAKVFAGTEILDGSLEIVVERTGSQTELNRINRTLRRKVHPEEASFRKRMDRMAYLSLITAGGAFLLTGSLNRSLVILLAASPSAAALAVPTANGVAIGKALQRGVYIKNGNYLWNASQVDTLVLDKIPSLTVGEVSIEEIAVTNKNYSERDIIRIASEVEGRENDPLIKIIRERGYQTNFGAKSSEVETEFIPKLGVRGKIKGQKILLGTGSLMIEEAVRIKRAESKALRYKNLGLKPVYLAVDGKLCGLLGVRETIKPDVRKAIEQLRALGIKVILVTRDDEETTEFAAGQLGITEFHSEMNPKQKAEFIKNLRAQGYNVGVLGDGIDDALAISEANVGIAWGKKGADSSARVAGIVITSQNPQIISDTLLLAQKTKEVAKQNMNLAIGLNVVGLGLGAGGFISQVSAAFLGEVGTIATLFNTHYQRWF